MKIRDGFVSNSSSSSFICIGVRFKAEHSKLYENGDDDKLLEVINNESAYYDGEGEGGYVYYGPHSLMDDEDWEFGRFAGFDKMMKGGIDKSLADLREEAVKMFEVPEKKVEIGMWFGRVAS